jgi:hypothetical protein
VLSQPAAVVVAPDGSTTMFTGRLSTDDLDGLLSELTA